MLGRMVAYLATGAGSTAVFLSNVETFSSRDFSQLDTWLNFNVLVTVAAAIAAALCVFLTVQNVLSATSFYKQSLDKHDANEGRLILLEESVKKLNLEIISLKWPEDLRRERSEDAVAWRRVLVTLDTSSYYGFKRNYPDSKHVASAQAHLDQLSQWQKTDKSDPFEVYRFLLSGPFDALRQSVESELAKSIKRTKSKFRDDLLIRTFAPLLPLVLLVYFVPVAMFFAVYRLLSGEVFEPLMTALSNWVIELGKSGVAWLSQQSFISDPDFVGASHAWLEANTSIWVIGTLCILLIALMLYLLVAIVLAPLMDWIEAHTEKKLVIAEQHHAESFEELI